MSESHQLETKPTLYSVSALRADLNSLMKRMSTRVADARQHATAQKSIQQEDIQPVRVVDTAIKPSKRLAKIRD